LDTVGGSASRLPWATDTRGPAILTAKLRRALRQLPYLPRALGLVWAASRGWTVAWVALVNSLEFLPGQSVNAAN